MHNDLWLLYTCVPTTSLPSPPLRLDSFCWKRSWHHAELHVQTRWIRSCFFFHFVLDRRTVGCVHGLSRHSSPAPAPHPQDSILLLFVCLLVRFSFQQHHLYEVRLSLCSLQALYKFMSKCEVIQYRKPV